MESVGKIGQFSSEFPRRRTFTVVSCYLVHFLEKNKDTLQRCTQIK